MTLSHPTKIFWAILMSVLMSNIPALAVAETAEGLISTSAVVDEMSRAQAQEKVATFLKREDVRKQLLKLGVQPSEVENRLAGLSENELRRLTQQMDQAQYGGDVGGILIIVLLVVLIVYLVRRI